MDGGWLEIPPPLCGLEGVPATLAEGRRRTTQEAQVNFSSNQRLTDLKQER